MADALAQGQDEVRGGDDGSSSLPGQTELVYAAPKITTKKRM